MYNKYAKKIFKVQTAYIIFKVITSTKSSLNFKDNSGTRHLYTYSSRILVIPAYLQSQHLEAKARGSEFKVILDFRKIRLIHRNGTVSDILSDMLLLLHSWEKEKGGTLLCSYMCVCEDQRWLTGIFVNQSLLYFL